jgi:hypothetical protein
MRCDYKSPELVKINNRSRTVKYLRGPINRRYGYGGMMALVMQFLPDFCFQTFDEILNHDGTD